MCGRFYCISIFMLSNLVHLSYIYRVIFVYLSILLRSKYRVMVSYAFGYVK